MSRFLVMSLRLFDGSLDFFQMLGPLYHLVFGSSWWIFSSLGSDPYWGLIKVIVAPESGMACLLITLFMLLLSWIFSCDYHSLHLSISSDDALDLSSLPRATISVPVASLAE